MNLKRIKMNKPLLIGPFTQLLPMTGLPLKGALKDEQLPIIENGGILVSEGKVLKVGVFDELKSDDVDVHHIEGQYVCLPDLCTPTPISVLEVRVLGIMRIEMPEKPIWKLPKQVVVSGIR